MDKRSASQWDDSEYQAKMVGKYWPEIQESRERDAQYEAERSAKEKDN
jgi:hypothetical protein